MQFSTFGDVRLGLVDFFNNKVGLVEKTAAYRICGNQLKTQLGLFESIHKSLADEVVSDPTLPKDLELKVFAYFHQMAANRALRGAKTEADEEPVTPST